MAFIVEDGTGKVDSNSYTSIENFKEYWVDRGVDYSTKTDTELQNALVKATQYIDTNYQFIGYKSTYDQSLNFPRYNAYTREGFYITGIPAHLIHAVCEAGAISLSGIDLFAKTEDGISEKTQNVGPIKTTYKYKNKQTKQILYSSVMNYLKGLLRQRSNKIRRY